jgi:DNA modification methylase
VSVRVLEGHVVDVLGELPPKHFHCLVCSPPYWKLRSYGTEPQSWADGWVGELGQEDSPEAFIAHLVDVFRAVRRVLRDDGSVWVNLAGAYFSEPGGQNGTGQSTLMGANTKHHVLRGISEKAKEANRQNGRNPRGKHPWLKPLDWVDIPGMFARAMQQDGWIWRSDVTWVKPSALPESVSGTAWTRCRVKTKAGTAVQRTDAWREEWGAHTPPHGTSTWPTGGQAEWADCPGCSRCAPDGYVLRRGNGRPTKSTERVLLFIKRPGAFFDAEAVREPHTAGHLQQQLSPELKGDPREIGKRFNKQGLHDYLNPAGRNLRDWWVLSPEPIADAHYAAYPTSLPDRCIGAGTSEWGCCPACGAPWARVVERERLADVAVRYADGVSPKHAARVAMGLRSPSSGLFGSNSHNSDTPQSPEVTTLGWRPTCRCPGATEPPAPCRVLDPFGGSGATALAANRLGRDCTLIELKGSYVALAKRRIGREPLSLFASRPEEVPV